MEVDDLAEHDDVIPGVNHPRDPAVNGRERVVDVRRAVEIRLETQAGGRWADLGAAEVARQVFLALVQDIDHEFAGLLNDVVHARAPVDRDLHEQRLERDRGD